MDDKVAKFVIKSDWATQQQVEECLAHQEEIRQGGQTAPTLLDVLVQKQYISPAQRDTLLKSMRKKGTRLFGEIAIDFQFITYAQLQECLEIQEKIKKTGQEDALGFPSYIGEILVSKNYLRAEEIKLILDAQKKESVAKETRTLEKAVNEVITSPTLSDSSKEIVQLDTTEAQKELVACKHCGSEFHMKITPGDKKLRCGQCGKLLFGEVTVRKTEAVARKKETLSLAQKITLSLPKLGRSRAKKLAIPDYQLGDVLGEDSTGTTYQAIHVSDHSQVAIKVFNEETCSDQKFMATLAESVHRCLSLRIPNTRKTLKMEKVQSGNKELTCLISEYIEGKSLRQVMQQGTTISTEKALTIITRLAKVLQYAKDEGIIHGDIAPHNILISKEGKVIIANLGIPNKVVNNLSRIAQMDGQASLYIAPELLEENRVCDYRSDIYALGALFYYILAKRPAFQGTSPFEVLNRLNDNTPLPAIQLYNQEVSADVFRIIENMMSPDVEKRYQNYQELVAHLHDPHLVNQVLPVADSSDVIQIDATAEKPEEDPGGKTLAHFVSARGNIENEGEEPSLRHLSARSSGAEEIPWNKIIFFLIFIIAIGVPVYFRMTKQNKIDQATQEYYRLREDYTRQRKNLNRVESLSQKLQICVDIQKKFKSYRERHRDVPFPKEQDMLKNADQHVKDIDRLKQSAITVSIRNILSKADTFLRKNQLCAALEVLTLNEIPDMYRDAKSEQSLVRKREEIVRFAQTLFEKAQQQAEITAKELGKSRDEQNFAVASDALNKLQKTISQIEKYIQDFTSEAKSRSALSSVLEKAEKDVAAWKQKSADYQQWIQEERPKKSQVVFQGILEKLKPLLEKYDYAQAERELQQALQSKTLFPELRDQLQQMKEHIGNVKTAREILQRHLNRLNTKTLKIYYQGRIYNVEGVSDRGEFTLRPSKKIAWQDFPQNQLHLLIDFIIPYASTDERFCLSFLCLELQEYPMAYKLLTEVAAQKEQAKTYLAGLDSKLKSTVVELFGNIQNPAWETQWEQSINSALSLHNQYLVSGLPYNEDQLRVIHDFYAKVFEKLFGHTTKRQVLFDFRNNENRLPAGGFQHAVIRMENEYLLFSGGSWSYSEKNIQGVAGLCRFTKENEKLELTLGGATPCYRMGIEASGKVVYNAYNPAKFQNTDLGSFGNKWFIFGLFLEENQMHWYINQKRLFFFPHNQQSAIDKIVFKASSSKEGGVALDDIYIGTESK
jgi:serine/threonine-protein kinase